MYGVIKKWVQTTPGIDEQQEITSGTLAIVGSRCAGVRMISLAYLALLHVCLSDAGCGGVECCGAQPRVAADLPVDGQGPRRLVGSRQAHRRPHEPDE